MAIFQRRVREYRLRPLDGGDSGTLADLHARGFARGWSEAEFEQLLFQDAVFGFLGAPAGRRAQPPAGFVLARQAGGEGEILTILVARGHRRHGLGRQLMDSVLRRLHAERAESLFLEVEENNAPAIALYRRLGFRQVGGRPDYYRTADGRRSGALVMRRDLR